jgi:hypothetical protein
MKILKSEIDWDKTINIQMTLKEFKLLQDCLFSVSYAELEKLQEKIPYSYDDMQETIKQSETILEQLFCK